MGAVVQAACPCGCPIEGTRLTKYGHVRGCACRRCVGLANQRRGREAEGLMHRSLGGTGAVPRHEGRVVFTLVVSPEVKTGDQVPACWRRFISSKFFAHAIGQNARDLPIGSVATPAVCVDGRFVVIDLRRR